MRSLVEWYRTKKEQMSEGDEQQRVAARMDLILGGKCTVQTYDCVKKGPRSNDTCPVCMNGFAPKLPVRLAASLRVALLLKAVRRERLVKERRGYHIVAQNVCTLPLPIPTVTGDMVRSFYYTRTTVRM